MSERSSVRSGALVSGGSLASTEVRGAGLEASFEVGPGVAQGVRRGAGEASGGSLGAVRGASLGAGRGGVWGRGGGRRWGGGAGLRRGFDVVRVRRPGDRSGRCAGRRLGRGVG